MDPETNDWVCEKLTGKPYRGRFLWLNIFIFSVTHTFGLYGLYLLVTKGSIYTWISCLMFYQLSILGVTVGGHRFYAHRSFTANLPLRIILMLMFSSSYQRDLIRWCRWHRCHHKWTDTDADPHSIHKGFFYAHMGWLLQRPTEDYEKKKHLIDVSDLQADPVVRFQVKHYHFVAVMCTSLGPALLAVYGWGEDPMTAISSAFGRWTLSLHVTWLINSMAHVWGDRPYDFKISAAGNVFSQISTLGEGYHNYHHTFPYDYRGSELGVFFKQTTVFIDFFAWLGWATNLKTTPMERVEKRRIQNLRNEQEHCAKG